jgi:hypothetical protein
MAGVTAAYWYGDLPPKQSRMTANGAYGHGSFRPGMDIPIRP